MYFDQFGKVRACCQNTGVYLGDVTTHTLRDIWTSASAEAMRSALDADDYSAGCDFCEWQVREGNDEIVFARHFDHLRPTEPRPTWPRQMEFSLTNTCNLQCAMCNGDWSSTIRTKRERRAPLPAVYDDAFFDQLTEFLPHLERARFLGGEPFLGKEPLRVMELLTELDHPPHVDITTNGTIWTDRVRRILETLQPHIVVSIDGASTTTYDAIRVGAHLPDVIANLDRFIDHVGPGRVSIAHCLMTTNWHEFADLLHLAEERNIGFGVNVVRFPADQSLYQLPPDQLRHITTTLHATPTTLTGERHHLWHHHLAALDHRLTTIEAGDPEAGPQHGIPGAPARAVVETPDGPQAIAVSSPWLPFPTLGEPATSGTDASLAPDAELEVGIDGTVTVVAERDLLGLDLRSFDGAHIDDLGRALVPLLGPTDTWVQEVSADDLGELYVVRPRDDADHDVQFRCRPMRDDTGRLIGGRYTLVTPVAS
jgi:MoaA/NifB/PqqE/SkfB family radical SAM enzyme